MYPILIFIATLTLSSLEEVSTFSIDSKSIFSRVNRRIQPSLKLSSTIISSSWPISTGPLPSQSSSSPSSSSSTSFSLLSPSSKFYQLEEMEDRESSTTEIFLSQDGTVTVTDTNGPPPVRSSGTWKAIAAPSRAQHNLNDPDLDYDYDESITGTFEMKITRTFRTGHDASDLGEFCFDVERTFIGDISTVGGLVSVTGSMHMEDDFFGDTEVGFFSMIDTTDAKLGEEQN
eukprot:CAMPEP_0203638214 /NCGR_PEP_ID=MMETSP0088-20131115/4303_1 /ASSEMBLY_ACC=CAM_ASM_001087 /TAXON_ID=426623 /ORGANISM="Chaetoceros affinis, Strain CCMP159" /LENGTH=230 /DNA_ID=CAMNT_0050492801 /DNA_START=175 /DNA_END=867 /DNA_ORIENTATION=+